MELADRIRTDINNVFIPSALHEGAERLGVSMGVCTAYPSVHSIENYLTLADRELYKAKAKGKNQVQSVFLRH